MKKIFALSIITILSITLIACNKNVATKGDEGSPSASTKVAIVTEKVEESKKNTEVKTEKKVSQEIEVFVAGNKEMRKALLTQSKQLGFEFYMLDGFGFDAEEPGKDILYSKLDQSFFVRIEKIDRSVNLTELKDQKMVDYKSLGEVTEVDPSTLFHQKFKDANVCFTTENKDIKGLNTSIIYIIKSFEGETFAFTFHMPLKEASEGITPSFWAMLSTITNL